MAEVDIFGIHFDPALSIRTLVGECKDRKGSAKEADRIVWLLGLKQVLACDEVLFAKPSMAEATMIWARPLQTILWDEAVILRLEQTAGVTESDGFVGSFRPDDPFVELAAARVGPAEQDLRRAWDYVSSSFWYTQSPLRARRLVGFLEMLSDVGPTLSPRAFRALTAEGILATIASALTVASVMKRYSNARARVYLTDLFSSGVASAAALRDVADRADEYYRDVIRRISRQAGRGEPVLDFPRIAGQIAQPPEWLDDFIAFAEKVGESSTLATDLLRFSDLVLLEKLVNEQNIPSRMLEAIQTNQTELLRLLQLTVYFLERVWKFNSPMLPEVLSMDLATLSDKAEVQHDRSPTQGSLGE